MRPSNHTMWYNDDKLKGSFRTRDPPFNNGSRTEGLYLSHSYLLYLKVIFTTFISIINQRIAPYFIIQTLKYYKTHIEL